MGERLGGVGPDSSGPGDGGRDGRGFPEEGNLNLERGLRERGRGPDGGGLPVRRGPGPGYVEQGNRRPHLSCEGSLQGGQGFPGRGEPPLAGEEDAPQTIPPSGRGGRKTALTKTSSSLAETAPEASPPETETQNPAEAGVLPGLLERRRVAHHGPPQGPSPPERAPSHIGGSRLFLGSLVRGEREASPPGGDSPGPGEGGRLDLRRGGEVGRLLGEGPSPRGTSWEDGDFPPSPLSGLEDGKGPVGSLG